MLTVISFGLPELLCAGGQYCAWSPASDLLAMSSDAFHAVLIWSVPSFQQVMSIEGTMEPALSITFSPCEPALLVFCERSGRLYILGKLVALLWRQKMQALQLAAAASTCHPPDGCRGSLKCIPFVQHDVPADFLCEQGALPRNRGC